MRVSVSLALLATLSSAAVAQTRSPKAPASATPTTMITVSEATDSQTTVSPDGKTILIDIQGRLWSLPITGGDAKPITDIYDEASHPDWSAKAGIVAIQSYAGGTFHVWTMRPDGTGKKQITSGHGDDREPRFSPDGTHIAFSSDRAFKGSYDIWTVDVASGALKQITSSELDEFEPNWSPDGSALVFASGTGLASKSIERVDLASGKQTTVASMDPLKGRLESPSFSPDGKLLSYIQFSGAGMFLSSAHLVITAAGSSAPPVYTGTANDAYPFPAVWLSPTELVYTGSGHIIRTDLNAKSETVIPFTATFKSIRPQYAHKAYNFDSTAPHPVKGIWEPALSPDGKQIAFVALNQLYLMPLGGKPVALTHDTFFKEGPAWSPDGSSLAYVSDKDGIENVYIHTLLSASDANDKRVSPSDEAQIFPAWSPDGKLIACQDHTGATVLIDVATGTVKPLAPFTFFPGRAAFSPNGKTVAIATIAPYTKRFREGTSSILAVDVPTGDKKFFPPAPYESITTRTVDGPIYAPNGKEMLFVMDDLLYTMAVDADGKPSGDAVKLGDETADAPTWSGDSAKILYLNNGRLRLMERATKAISPVPVDLTWSAAKPTQKLLLHAGHFWKGTGADEQADVDILITDNRITSVTPHSATPPAGVTRTVEAGSLSVIPGLVESHAHNDSDNSIYYGDREGRLWLAYGITQVRGVADNAYRTLQHREAYTSGAAVGPRLFTTGEAVDGERVYYPMMIPTTSEAQLHREFERLKALDFDFIKLYVRLPFNWAEQGIQFAHTQMGVETASHYLIPAVEIGEDGMTHVSATSRTGWAYQRSYTGVGYEDAVDLMAKSGMWTISTTFSQAQYKEYPELATEPRRAISPPWENTRIKTALSNAQTNDTTVASEKLKEEEAVVAKVIRSGGTILAGTDSPLDLPATSLHLNLRAQVKYGLAPWEALETATSAPAKALGISKDLGTLEPGKLADLILVSGDPLKNINDAAAVQCVMTNGVLRSVGSIMAPFVKGDSTGDSVCGTH